MEFRRARREDLDAAWGIIEDGRASLAELGIDQWQGTSPTRGMLQEDIGEGRGYVAVADGRPVGYLMLNDAGEEIYDDIAGNGWITGSDSNDPHYLAVHRVAVEKSAKGCGVGRFMLEQALRMAEECGFESVRIDTHRGNVVMRGLLASLGYSECGIVLLPEGAEFTRERIAYEKVV